MHNVITPNESYKAAELLLPTGVYAGVATQLKVFMNDSSTAAYGLNDGVVVLCLGVATLTDSVGAPLDGTEITWS